MDGFDNVTSILIFRDSEKSSKSACESVNNSLKKYEYGTFEHLCLRLFKEKSVNEKVKTYLDDFQLKTENFRKLHKNELYATFSFTDNFVGLKIGETAKAGGFDFDAPYLLPFLRMIKEM